MNNIINKNSFISTQIVQQKLKDHSPLALKPVFWIRIQLCPDLIPQHCLLVNRCNTITPTGYMNARMDSGLCIYTCLAEIIDYFPWI